MSRSANHAARFGSAGTLRPTSRSTLTFPLAGLLSLALFALAACAKREAPEPSDQILRISQRNEPVDLDPQLATLPDEFFILRALSEGLVTPAPAGRVQPGVAEKWETSPDGLTWTFHLRANARWSNGDPVVAGDFVSSYRRLLAGTFAAPKARLFFAVKNAAAFNRGELPDFASVGFAAPSERTLVITLEHPTPHLLALVASGPWLPVHVPTVEKQLGTTHRSTAWTRPGNFVGNGPFVLRDWRPHQFISVGKSLTYWDAASVPLSEIHFVAMDNGDAEERAFRAGQLDVTLSVPTTKIPTYETAQPPTLHRVALAETRYLAVNTQRPPLNDVRVRRALSLALDRVALTDKVMKGGQIPADTYLPPGLGGYEPAKPWRQEATALAAARVEARHLLADAGFPNGRGFPRLELSSWSIAPAVLEAVQQMWRQELGLEIGLAQREGKVHLAALAAGEYDLGFMPAIADYDDPSGLLEELTTGATGNYSQWSDPGYNGKISSAAREPDAARRSALYREAEAILLRELPVIPLYFNSQNFLLSPRVKGWQSDRLWNRYYKALSLE